MASNCEKSLGFWTIGIQYLHLVSAVSNEIINQDNAHCIVSGTKISVENPMGSGSIDLSNR